MDTTYDMTAEVERQRKAQKLVDRHVLQCQSSLVEGIMAITADLTPAICLIGYEDIEGLYDDVDSMSGPELVAWAMEEGVDVPTEAVDEDGMVDADFLDACREQANENPTEIYEWWLVTEWLYRRLRAMGHPGICDDGFNHWWGRCTTGQSIILDCDIQTLAAGLWPRST